MRAMARALFDPSAAEPFPISRSKLELFLECPRCFWLDRRTGACRPDTAHYLLNLAVDALMKREFDACRIDKKPHHVMDRHGVEAVPFQHPMLSTWRDSPKGIRFAHACGIELFGIVDDVWVDAAGAVHPVDYKGTSVAGVPRLDDRDGYKRQLDVYGWLLGKNGFRVADVGFIVFANADRERDALDGALRFTLSIAEHRLDLGWIDETLPDIRECLESDVSPASTNDCAWCAYRRSALASEA